MNKEKIVNFVKLQTLQFAVNKDIPVVVIGEKPKPDLSTNRGFPIGAMLYFSHSNSPIRNNTLRLVHPSERIRGINGNGSSIMMSRDLFDYSPVPFEIIEELLTEKVITAFLKHTPIILV